tara:strand:- start:18024 stop:18185 length:162 start_codon:yes stop_codon:yes gene_type:complete
MPNINKTNELSKAKLEMASLAAGGFEFILSLLMQITERNLLTKTFGKQRSTFT